MNVPFRTTTGMIDLADLKPRNVTARILGDSLAKINRFNGRTPEPWSVASHSVLVSRLCGPEHKAWGLLHDAHEVFLGDIVTPAVDLMIRIDPRVRSAIDGTKRVLDKAILDAWGIQPVFARRGVHQMDRLAYMAEVYVFMGAEVAIIPELADAFDAAVSLIDQLPRDNWRSARDLWIAEAEYLAALGLLRLPKEPESAT